MISRNSLENDFGTDLFLVIKIVGRNKFALLLGFCRFHLSLIGLTFFGLTFLQKLGTDLVVNANDLRAELNTWFLRQTDSKLRTYVSIMALVEEICFGFITQHNVRRHKSKAIAELRWMSWRRRNGEIKLEKVLPPLNHWNVSNLNRWIHKFIVRFNLTDLSLFNFYKTKRRLFI